MEEGQYPQQSVVRAKVEHLGNRLDIRKDVEVRELDALGLARASTGKDHGQDIVDLIAVASHQPPHERNRQRQREDTQQAIDGADLFLDILEIDGLAGNVDWKFVEKRARRHDLRDPALLRCRQQRILARCVIEVDDRLAEERRRDVRDASPDRRRKQQANAWLIDDVSV